MASRPTNVFQKYAFHVYIRAQNVLIKNVTIYCNNIRCNKSYILLTYQILGECFVFPASVYTVISKSHFTDFDLNYNPFLLQRVQYYMSILFCVGNGLLQLGIILVSFRISVSHFNSVLALQLKMLCNRQNPRCSGPMPAQKKLGNLVPRAVFSHIIP